MDVSPYWAYEPVPGMDNETEQEEARDEGRRAFALQVATRWDDTDEGHLATARKFEQYLKGGAAPEPDAADRGAL